MKTLRIGLLWHAFGWPNLGVDALSRTNIDIIRTAAARAGVGVEFVLLGKPGNGAPVGADIRQGQHFRLRNLVDGKFGRYMDSLKACDLIVDICAGDGFTSIYGVQMFGLHAATKIFAIASGRPLLFSPQTIGPFDSGWTRAIAKWIIKRARVMFARDQLSTKAFKSLGVETPFEEVIDVAFRLPFTRPERAAGGPTRIGINVSGLLYNHGDRFSLTADYKDVTHRLVTHFLSLPDTEVWLVSHVLSDDGASDIDCPAVAAVAALFPAAKVAPRFDDAVAAKSFIAGLDFFTGGRMHACIGAFSAGVPVVPFAYSRKFNGLFETLGYSRFVDGRVVDADTAVAATIAGFEARETLAREIVPGMAEANRRLAIYEDKVVELLQEVAARARQQAAIASPVTGEMAQTQSAR